MGLPRCLPPQLQHPIKAVTVAPGCQGRERLPRIPLAVPVPHRPEGSVPGRTRPCHLLPLSWPSWVPAGPGSGRSLCSRWRLPKRKATTSPQHAEGRAGLPGPLCHRAPLAHITQPAVGWLSLGLGLQPWCHLVMPGRGHRRRKTVPVVLAEQGRSRAGHDGGWSAPAELLG